jgi:hypothetical protein
VSFVKFPKHVLYSRALSAHAKLLYAVLCGYAYQKDYCFPSYARLCEDMQLSERAIRKALHELIAAGLVEKRQRGNKQPNIYILCEERPAQYAGQTPEWSAQCAGHDRHNMPTNKKKKNNHIDRENKKFTEEEREAYFQQFAQEKAVHLAFFLQTDYRHSDDEPTT